MTSLFEPASFNGLNLKNRIIMAPMTRSRASADGVHGAIAATYYAQRAGAGLIISEATAVSKQGSGYPHIPGIWNDAQVKGWQGVTKAVHDAGGKIFLQIFHTGRVGHTSLMGETPVSSSNVPPQGQVMAADFSMRNYETPRALKMEEIPDIVAQFKTGAENAKRAGFNGIEIHSANGYLIDQFLRDGVNDRTDQYGGSIENRVRLLREILEAAIKIWGDYKVGLRLSPYSQFNSMRDSHPMKDFTAIAAMLNALPLAYLHIIEPVSGESAIEPRITNKIRDIYKGVIIANGGISKSIAENMARGGNADLFAFGAPFIANPDLVDRLRKNIPLTQPDSSLFYAGGEKGYIDYPTANAKAA